MSNHTQGPWTIAPRGEDDEPWDCVDIMAGEYQVAAAIYDVGLYDAQYHDDDLYLPVVDANARLIAAAPKMLEALNRAECHMQTLWNHIYPAGERRIQDDPDYQIVCEAIDIAEGRK